MLVYFYEFCLIISDNNWGLYLIIHFLLITSQALSYATIPLHSKSTPIHHIPPTNMPMKMVMYRPFRWFYNYDSKCCLKMQYFLAVVFFLHKWRTSLTFLHILPMRLCNSLMKEDCVWCRNSLYQYAVIVWIILTVPDNISYYETTISLVTTGLPLIWPPLSISMSSHFVPFVLVFEVHEE